MFSDNMWTETPRYSDSIGAWTYTSLTSSLFPVYTNLNGVASVHPVIEISKNKISY